MWEARSPPSQRYYSYGHVICVTGANPTPDFPLGEIYIWEPGPYHFPLQHLPTPPTQWHQYIYRHCQVPPTHQLAREPAHRQLRFPTGPTNPPTAREGANRLEIPDCLTPKATNWPFLED